MKPSRPEVVATEIRMLRSQYRGTFLLTEGRDDRLLLEHVTNSDACRVKVCDGKSRVREIVRILEESAFGGVLGVVDANLDRVEGVATGSPNILVTDDHDLDCMQVRSAALDAVLLEFGSPEKLAKFGKDVRGALIGAAMPIACLRLHSRRANLALRFEGVSYAECVDAGTLEPKVDGVIREIKNHSNRHDISDESLRAAIAAVQSQNHDPWNLCNGADLLGILSLGLRSAIGSHSGTGVAESVLRPVLRVAYREHFPATRLRQDLDAWGQANDPYRVF